MADIWFSGKPNIKLFGQISYLPIIGPRYLTDRTIVRTLICYDCLQDSLNSTRLRWSVSFLPLARSSATLDYYFAVMEESRADYGAIADGVTKVVAMDLGTMSCNVMLKSYRFRLCSFSFHTQE